MPLISTKLHGVLDYAGGLGAVAAARFVRDRRASAILGVAGADTLVTSSLTDYELGLRRIIPMRVHLVADAAMGGLLLTAAGLLRSRGAKLRDLAPLAIVGLSELAGSALTQRQPADRVAPTQATEGTPQPPPGQTTAADGPPLAPPPVEAPGPSVTPPASPEADLDSQEREEALTPGEPATDDALVAREESAAAAQAAQIGGAVPPETDDPALEPVYQAGGGEQDGWEEAEDELIENASHGEGRAHPERDAFSPELESDRSSAVYGEADALPSSELADDEGRPAQEQ